MTTRRTMAAACAVAIAFTAAVARAQSAPSAITLRASSLARAASLVRAGDRTIKPAYEKLLADAAKQLTAPVVAVTDKRTSMPPSGNKHDYFSLSPYWWPDSTKPDGLPYVRHDGVTNPESKRDLDQPRVAQMGENVSTLALAYWFTRDEKYAARAARQLRAWFLDSATKMTPHLRYAQLVRGNPQERGSGIIDTRWFIEVVDAASLMRGATSWTAGDNAALQAWLKQYLAWLRDSPNGKHEHDAKNNHGSWYAAQTAALAMFTGDSASARDIVTEAKTRVGWQITPRGEQPLELERTKSMHYSGFNVEALSRVAEIGARLGVDLWAYEAPEGGSLRKAIDNLAKYMGNPKAWPGQEISDVDLSELLIHLRRANAVYGGETYNAVLASLPAKAVREDRSGVLYP